MTARRWHSSGDPVRFVTLEEGLDDIANGSAREAWGEITMSNPPDLPRGSYVEVGYPDNMERFYVWSMRGSSIVVRGRLPWWWRAFGPIIRWYRRNTRGAYEPLMTAHPWVDTSLMPEWDRPTR